MPICETIRHKFKRVEPFVWHTNGLPSVIVNLLHPYFVVFRLLLAPVIKRHPSGGNIASPSGNENQKASLSDFGGHFRNWIPGRRQTRFIGLDSHAYRSARLPCHGMPSDKLAIGQGFAANTPPMSRTIAKMEATPRAAKRQPSKS